MARDGRGAQGSLRAPSKVKRGCSDEVLHLKAACREFFHGRFRCLMLGEDSDDCFGFQHLTSFRNEGAPKRTYYRAARYRAPGTAKELEFRTVADEAHDKSRDPARTGSETTQASSTKADRRRDGDAMNRQFGERGCLSVRATRPHASIISTTYPTVLRGCGWRTRLFAFSVTKLLRFCSRRDSHLP